MSSHLQVTVAGRLPVSTAGSIRSRFGAVDVHPVVGTTAVSVTVSDQSALRALLELIWDSGAAVVALSVDDGPRTSGSTGALVDEGSRS
jgi:hypothetical protein